MVVVQAVGCVMYVVTMCCVLFCLDVLEVLYAVAAMCLGFVLL